MLKILELFNRPHSIFKSERLGVRTCSCLNYFINWRLFSCTEVPYMLKYVKHSYLWIKDYYRITYRMITKNQD